MVVMLVPFALSQARLAFFPQLEPAAWQGPTTTITGALTDAAPPRDYTAPAPEAIAEQTFRAQKRGSRRTRRRQPEWPMRQRPSP